jgi:hypothetical protein
MLGLCPRPLIMAANSKAADEPLSPSAFTCFMLPCLIRLASSLASSLEAKIERILFVSKKHQNQ